MTVFTWLWVAWALAFVAVEGTALIVKDRPGHAATLSAHVWWLVRGAGAWHQVARVIVAAGLTWLSWHLLG